MPTSRESFKLFSVVWFVKTYFGSALLIKAKQQSVKILRLNIKRETKGHVVVMQVGTYIRRQNTCLMHFTAQIKMDLESNLVRSDVPYWILRQTKCLEYTRKHPAGEINILGRKRCWYIIVNNTLRIVQMIFFFFF